jgi:hypothetical protein
VAVTATMDGINELILFSLNSIKPQEFCLESAVRTL